MTVKLDGAACTRYWVLAVATLSACASTRDPSIAVEGYERIPVPPGCYGHTSEKEHNLRLSPELERRLLATTAPHPSTGQACWYETRNHRVKLTFGDECLEYQEFVLERTEDRWLVVSHNEVPFVMCHRR